MSNTMSDQELEGFFAQLRTKLPASGPLSEPPPPSAKLLELAREAARANRSMRAKPQAVFSDRFLLMAAADRSDLRDTTTVSQSGEWTMAVYRRVDRPDEGYVLCELSDPTPEKLAEVEGLTGVLQFADGTVLKETISDGMARFDLKYSALSEQKEISLGLEDNR